MVTSRYESIQLKFEKENLLLSQQETEANEAFANYPLVQGMRTHIDKLGYPVLEGEDIYGILMSVDELLQPRLAKTLLRMQKASK